MRPAANLSWALERWLWQFLSHFVSFERISRQSIPSWKERELDFGRTWPCRRWVFLCCASRLNYKPSCQSKLLELHRYTGIFSARTTKIPAYVIRLFLQYKMLAIVCYKMVPSYIQVTFPLEHYSSSVHEHRMGSVRRVTTVRIYSDSESLVLWYNKKSTLLIKWKVFWANSDGEAVPHQQLLLNLTGLCFRKVLWARWGWFLIPLNIRTTPGQVVPSRLRSKHQNHEISKMKYPHSAIFIASCIPGI